MLFYCKNCGSILVSLDGMWVCSRANKVLIGPDHKKTVLCEHPTVLTDWRYKAPIQSPVLPGRVGVPRVGHKLRIKPQLHTGLLMVCRECNPETAEIHIAQLARLKQRKGVR